MSSNRTYLADAGIYIASESTTYRILQEKASWKSKPPIKVKYPTTYIVATATAIENPTWTTNCIKSPIVASPFFARLPQAVTLT